MSAPSMYRAVMGDAFDRLAAPIKEFHTLAGSHTLRGEVSVGAPASILAKVLAIFLGAPLKAQRGAIRFDLVAEPNTESWTRVFPNKTMHSTLERTDNRITERLGVARLAFELLEINGALEMRLETLHFFGVSCPKWLMPVVIAKETGEVHKLHFHIQASVPIIGMVTSYTGYLHISQEVPE